MKYTELAKYNHKLFYIKSFVIFILCMQSCKSTTSIYALYCGGLYPSNTSLFINKLDSSYVYSYNYYGYDNYKEYGYFMDKQDTIILIPIVQIEDDSCSNYNPKNNWRYASINNDSLYVKDIFKRYYTKKNNCIKDITLDMIYPDSNANSMLEKYDLYMYDIQETQEEKILVKYAKKKYDHKINAMDVFKKLKKESGIIQ